MTVTNLEILASRTTDEVLHGDEKRASVDARLRSHGFTAADTRRIGDMIRSNELTINIHLGSIVGWHAGLEPALGNSSFALRNTFSSKEARGMKMDSTGYLVKRDAVEKYYFPEYSSAEMKGQERPLYAAFNPMKAESGGIGKSSSYGGTVVILKQHVKQQATYTLDDSFYKLVVSTSDDARDSFKAALAEAFRSKLSSENFNKFFGPDGTVAALIDSQYVTFSGRDLTASRTLSSRRRSSRESSCARPESASGSRSGKERCCERRRRSRHRFLSILMQSCVVSCMPVPKAVPGSM